jgi:hypothetical protein
MVSFNTIENQVKNSISSAVLKEMSKLITSETLNLWGESQPRGFIYQSLVLCLYKDLSGFGFRRVLRRSKSWFQLSCNSFIHNCNEIRTVLAQWGRRQVVLGNLVTWNRAARHCSFPKDISDACMLIDSSDFKIKGRRTVSRKDPSWSYKLNAPGRRFTLLIDCKRRILKAWGGYSPKVYDGDFITTHRDFFEDQLTGAAILGDQHYSMGKTFGNVKFYVPWKKPNKKKVGKEDSSGLETLSKEKQRWNDIVRKARARVELPFSDLKMTWKSLAQPWNENVKYLDMVIWIAIGVHNRTLEISNRLKHLKHCHFSQPPFVLLQYVNRFNILFSSKKL